MATRAGQRYSFEFGPNSLHLASARAFVASLAGEAGCSSERVLDLKIAVSEACTNAIRAHAAIDADDPIEVIVAVDDGSFRVEIADAGGGFEVRPTNADPKDPSLYITGGLGLGVIRALFPDADIGGNDRGGTTVQLRLRLDEDVS